MTTLFSNNAVARLAATVYAGATSFSVEEGYGPLFPEPGPNDQFYVRFGTDWENEIVRVTGRVGDVFACDALAAPWVTHTAVVLTVCAELLDGVFGETRDASVEASVAASVEVSLEAVAPSVATCQEAAVATAADRVQTGLDVAATAADRVATGDDRAFCDAIATETMGDALVYIADDSESVTLGIGESLIVTEGTDPYPNVTLTLSVPT